MELRREKGKGNAHLRRRRGKRERLWACSREGKQAADVAILKWEAEVRVQTMEMSREELLGRLLSPAEALEQEHAWPWRKGARDLE